MHSSAFSELYADDKVITDFWKVKFCKITVLVKMQTYRINLFLKNVVSPVTCSFKFQCHLGGQAENVEGDSNFVTACFIFIWEK